MPQFVDSFAERC